MKCAEQVRNVYVRIQMWNTIYCYIISTNMHFKCSMRIAKSKLITVIDAQIYDTSDLWSICDVRKIGVRCLTYNLPMLHHW